MALLGDYHTHTNYSHGKSTIEENVQSAVAKGLTQIAITEHGFKHRLYGVKREDIKKMREDIDAIKDKYPIEIFLGIEANIMSFDGEVDICLEDYNDLDIVIVGYHIATIPGKHGFWFKMRNHFYKLFKIATKKTIRKNTEAYVKAMRNYDIDIISHPSRFCPVNMDEIAKVAVETNTLIELNGKNIGMTDDQIMTCYKAGCKFILDSDAHHEKDVGNVNKGLQKMLKLRLPESCIVNYNSLPTFKKDKVKRVKK